MFRSHLFNCNYDNVTANEEDCNAALDKLDDILITSFDKASQMKNFPIRKLCYNNNKISHKCTHQVSHMVKYNISMQFKPSFRF